MAKFIEKQSVQDKFVLVQTKKGNTALKSLKTNLTYTYDLDKGAY